MSEITPSSVDAKVEELKKLLGEYGEIGKKIAKIVEIEKRLSTEGEIGKKLAQLDSQQKSLIAIIRPYMAVIGKVFTEKGLTAKAEALPNN